MGKDPTERYFGGTERDRAAFEAGIKLGAISHQFAGVPITSRTAASIERAIEFATRLQPHVTEVKARVDRTRVKPRGPYRYATLEEHMLRVRVVVRVGQARAIAELRFVPELDYPLMYLKEMRGRAKS